MTGLLAVHFGLAILAPALTRILGQRIFLLVALAPAAAAVWLLRLAPTILAGRTYQVSYTWVPSLDLTFDFRIGLLQWVLGLVVSVVGALVLFYCRWYFGSDRPQPRVAGLLVAFAGSMLGLVTADNVLFVYVFWELTTVFSYLLVGHNPRRAANRGAALTALLVTTFGGLAMLGGLVMLGSAAGSYSLVAIVDAAPRGAFVVGATVLVLLGALTKSAQVPFHFWLPGAMAAPTPVSAYLHSAAMVKAGVYLIAVLAPGFADVPGWRPLLMSIGAVTMVLGGYRALRQNDIKLLLAYGTVSQLGFLFVLFGSGTRAGTFAGLALLVSHAVFKSTLFLSVGIIDHSTGTRDLRELSGVGRQMPWVAAAATLAGLSMAGLPPTAGYLAKEAAFEASVNWVVGPLADGTRMLPGPAAAMVAMLVVGSVFTVAYTLRFLWGAFAPKAGIRKPTTVHHVAAGFALAPVVLGLTGLLLGALGPQWSAVTEPYGRTMAQGHEPEGLALWHGVTPPFLLSVACWVLGAGMFLLRTRVQELQGTMPAVMPANEVFHRFIRWLDRFAVEVTARVQPGSLPSYLGAILGMLVLFTGTAAFLQPGLGAGVRLWDSPVQALVGIVMCVAAWLAANARGRLKAVILVGVTGYGLALLFLLHGAPDLALTQVLTETVSIVVFVLVLRKLPKYFTDRPLTSTRWWRIFLAIAVGATVVATMLVATTARIATPISTEFYRAALEFGHGTNIVNVTLVDTRAWDTLGEITVLLVAATGVASLIFIRARYTRRTPAEEREVTARGQGNAGPRYSWLRGGEALSPLRRSLAMEVVTRLLFPVMMIVSFYLLMAGHNAPGGGFAGGLIAGLALVLRYLAGGRHELDDAAPVDAGVVLGSGLVVAVAAAVAPLAYGGAVLQSYAIDIHLPGLAQVTTFGHTWSLLSDIHIVTSVFFDIGVYLVVIGLLLDIARSLGAGIDVQAEQDRAPLPRVGGGVRGGRSAVRLPGRHFDEPAESEV
ncbi:multisubunit sodium/proton antiporter, MrpA subunit /multisubunit sodium/proton antiporter, MrpB subunit [Raineyella antarctica]|uniref:Multisubunit sodium/proton antiporter, MrpA subunit /multisubunit sodium/proton antiporter, MrpB subunit n=1 Tax=Raineyella antarctica TaxID=1577474 RepID=A0A1G6H1S1_9ACTN|nr:Na+/H+ antiporter subunit A [Raineyella antarctica]SDB88141.1 multisubunit sodium/proton antiporter, MrpA subunit /multisubunit sodium/proton antiporter, MrpB subunit [Raineyella antarctica]